MPNTCLCIWSGSTTAPPPRIKNACPVPMICKHLQYLFENQKPLTGTKCPLLSAVPCVDSWKVTLWEIDASHFSIWTAGQRVVGNVCNLHLFHLRSRVSCVFDSLCLKVPWFGTKLLRDYHLNSDWLVYMMTVYLENYIQIWTGFRLLPCLPFQNEG